MADPTAPPASPQSIARALEDVVTFLNATEQREPITAGSLGAYRSLVESLKYIRQATGQTIARISNDIIQAEKTLARDKLVTGPLEATSTLIWVSSVEADHDTGCKSSLDDHTLTVSET